MTTDTADKGPYHILLVEDNPGDAELIMEVIEDSEHQAEVVVVEDGEPAMAYLRHEGSYTNAKRPDLLLLDLNLPVKDGLEVLKDMAADQDLSTIPVMILTGTEAEESLLESYNIPVSRFSRKPIELSRFNTVMSQISDPAVQCPIVFPPTAQPASQPKERKWWWPF